MKAWLITWEWDSKSAAVADKVIGILNPRWSVDRVSLIAEFLYNQRTLTILEMASYAKRPSNNPYRPKKDFNSHIICGHHPYIKARIVKELRVLVNSTTELETITWIELPRYRPDDKEIMVKISDEIPKEYTRRVIGAISNEMIWDRKKGNYKDWWLKLPH